MRKLREVLRLRFELKLGYQQIGRSCSIGVSTVHKYLKRAEAAGVTWPLPEDWDEARVEAMVFPRREPSIAEHNPARTPPDFAAIHEQLRGSKYVTLQLLWEEYRQAQPGWLSLLAILRAVPALALEARRGAAAGAQSRREDVRRLGRRDDSGL